MIYTVGFVLVMCVYIVYAGYSNMFQGKYGFDFNRFVLYCMLAFVVSLAWPVAFPAIALYKLGKYYGDRK